MNAARGLLVASLLSSVVSGCSGRPATSAVAVVSSPATSGGSVTTIEGAFLWSTVPEGERWFHPCGFAEDCLLRDHSGQLREHSDLFPRSGPLRPVYLKVTGSISPPGDYPDGPWAYSRHFKYAVDIARILEIRPMRDRDCAAAYERR